MEKELNKNDEIDLKNFLSIFLRNKKLIIATSLLFFIFGIIISIFSQKKWEGNFQIVLKPQTNEEGLLSNNITPINNLLPFSLSGGSMDVNTQVGILESPSVLMPIFKYVSNEKSALNKNYNISFRDWKSNNLKVSLKEKTYILDIIYKDKDKKIVLPVLGKISKAYEQYADKKQKKSYSYTINFLRQQVAKYKEQSKASLKKVQEFAIDQDLVLLSDYNLMSESNDSLQNLEVVSNADLELVRITANNNIKQIDLQIERIKSLDLDENSSIIPFLGIIENDLSIKNSTSSLERIEEEIVKNSAKYTNKDPIIQRLYEERKETLKFLKTRAIGILKAKRLVAESMKESATRPKDVLLEYKNLLRESYRDEKTLLALENRLRTVSLANSKKKEPYELITQPTLLDKPIGLRKSRAGIFGIFLGLILGFIYALFKEKTSKFVIQMEDIRKYIDIEFLKKLDLNIDSEKNNLSKFIIDQHSLKPTPVNILIDENIEKKFLNKIKTSCNFLEKNYKIETNIMNLNEIFKKDNNLIFITSLNKLKYSQLAEISERFSILNIKVSAIFCCD